MSKLPKERPNSFENQILSQAPALIVVYNIQTGQYLFVNGAIKKILGYNPETFLKGGLPYVSSLVHPDDLPSIIEKNSQALKKMNQLGAQKYDSQFFESFEYRIKAKDGSYRWLHTDGSVFNRGGDGKVLEVLNASIDITSRKEAELKAVESSKDERDKLNNLVVSVPGVVWEVLGKPNSNKQTPSFVSGYVEKMLGYSVDQWVREPNFWLTIIHPVDKERVEKEFLTLFEGGKGGVSRFRWISKEGKVIWVESHLAVLKDRNGKTVGLRGVTMDISERMELERRKDEFISIASHELKTPITSLKGYIQILRQFCHDQNLIHYLSKLDGQVDRLTELVSDLLDVSKVQSAKLALRKERFEIDRLIEEVIEDLRQTDPKHQLVFFAGAKKRVYADRYRINQVLVNLISNAIKYSPRSDKVIINSSAKNGAVRVQIQDFGIGINPKEREKIFQPFYQASNKIRRSQAGLGLGLYIASEIIKRHGGEIWIQSQKDQGSTFGFSLPI